MLYSEIIAVCSQIHTKHINILCGQNVEFVNVKHGGTYSNHRALKSFTINFMKVQGVFSFVQSYENPFTGACGPCRPSGHSTTVGTTAVDFAEDRPWDV
jgi:hypothetical protein